MKKEYLLIIVIATAMFAAIYYLGYYLTGN